MKLSLDEACRDSWGMAGDGWDIDMESQGLCVEVGGEGAVGKGNV